MKGIILAGGKGTRMYPSTKVICKQLLPIYDKPMIFYPLSVLMISGIQDILIITNESDLESFKKLLGDGSNIGCNITYKVQDNPNGIAEAFIIGEEFIGNESVCLILGDNILYGSGLGKLLRSKTKLRGASIFGIEVNNPSAFGVVEIDHNQNIISIEEKPKMPKSNLVVPGIYYYDNSVIEYAKKIKPSKRGEKEITDLNKLYLEKKSLNIDLLPRGVAWLDTGTPENIFEASEFVRVTQKRTYKKIACIEEIAYLMNYIDIHQFKNEIEKQKSPEYKQYLKKLL